MIRLGVPGTPFTVFGTVRGLVEDARRFDRTLFDLAPEAVGVGLSPEEFEGLAAYFVDAPAEPWVPLTENEGAELRAFVRFGTVRLPHPSMVYAVVWGRRTGRPVEPLDPGEDLGAAWFTEHIGYVELVRRTVRERGLVRRPPEALSADDLAIAWDERLAAGAGSRRYREARDRHLAREARRLAEGRRVVAVVVDRERAERVAALLAADAPAAP